MEPAVIATADGFAAAMERLRGAPVVALDTEAASFHRYHDRIYLIQASTPDWTGVIDPLAVGDLTPIGTLLADGAVEKIFHDADYDLRLFDREFGFHARRLFDTRVAAQFLNEPGIGLGALLLKYFGVALDKKFQRADWSARPLSDAMVKYAAEDTKFLCQLRELLLEKLVAIGRREWVEEECTLQERIRWGGPSSDPAGAYLEVKGAKHLQPRPLALFRELHQWREATASRLDRAGFRIVGNETLFALAEHPVRTLDALGGVKGIGREAVSRWGREMLEAIARGEAVAEEDLPRIPRAKRVPLDPAYVARVERLKVKRNALATEHDLAPGVLCPNGTLEAIARALPQNLDELASVPGVRRWQVQAFGRELLGALS